jgi:hypothetical protein
MTRNRVLVFLSLICLIVAPFAFADKSKDKDKDSKKSSPPKQSSSHSGEHDSGSHSEHHGSSSGSSSSSSSSSDSSGSHHHSGDSHDQGDVIHNHSSGDSSNHSHDSHDGSGTHSSHQAESSHDHGSHDSSHSSHASHDTHVRIDNSHHTTIVVDHARLHERMAVHPGTLDRQHAYEHSREERVRFERHVGAIHFVPAHRVVLTRIRIVPTTYYYRRNVFYDTYGWHASPYVYHLYPRYGLWDATFLAFALDHIAEEEYALMFYHHRHDAEIQQWMDDNDRLAADNEDLRAQLDEMKAKMDTFEQSGVATDSAYVPADAQDVALSPEVITQLTAKKE